MRQVGLLFPGTTVLHFGLVDDDIDFAGEEGALDGLVGLEGQPGDDGQQTDEQEVLDGEHAEEEEVPHEEETDQVEQHRHHDGEGDVPVPGPDHGDDVQEFWD